LREEGAPVKAAPFRRLRQLATTADDRAEGTGGSALIHVAGSSNLAK